jgi:nitrogen fixation/metabolism regulation signal transduction histidine kinase
MMVRELKITNDLSIRTEKINVWQDIAQRLAHENKKTH